MFRESAEEVWQSTCILLSLLVKGEIQDLKHNGDRLFDEIRKGYVIVIYTWGEEERDRVKQKLRAVGFSDVPWRRGCKAFEQRFGHWKSWSV